MFYQVDPPEKSKKPWTVTSLEPRKNLSYFSWYTGCLVGIQDPCIGLLRIPTYIRIYIYIYIYIQLGSIIPFVGVSLNGSTPKSSILIGFSIIFTIHFGVSPLFLETPIYSKAHKRANLRLLTSAAQTPREDVRRKVSIIGHDLSFEKNVTSAGQTIS